MAIEHTADNAARAAPDVDARRADREHRAVPCDDTAVPSESPIAGESTSTPPTASSDILSGPLRRPLVRLALPMLGAFLFQLGFNWVDTFFVARLGADALAAVARTS